MSATAVGAVAKPAVWLMVRNTMSEAAFRPSPGWRFAGHAVLVALCLSVVVPMAIVLGTSFKVPNEVYRLQPWPDAPTMENYARLFGERAFGP